MNATHESFGQRLLRLRNENKMSQRVLAEKAKISRWRIVALEGGHIPSVDTMMQIARVFRVTLDYLCGVTDDPEERWQLSMPVPVAEPPRVPVYQMRTMNQAWIDCSEQAYKTTELERRILYK